MITEDQSDVIAFLSDPASHSGQPVDRFETHISEVFLTGERAYKLKRAVKLPYLDFSTAKLREEVCRKEVLLNRVTAPDLYLGIRLITKTPGGTLGFDCPGELVDTVVEMVRFEQEFLLDHLAAVGRLTIEILDQLARVIEKFHQNAPQAIQSGGYHNIANVLSINEAGFATSNIYSKEELEAVNFRFHSCLEHHRDLLDRRQYEGKIRRCHGDLHLRNIVLIDGAPVLFDCLEFNDEMATIDVLYDLAFLIMDLCHRDLNGQANRIVNRYIDHSFDDEGFVLVPFFTAIRAAVRAHVIATQAAESSECVAELTRTSRSYFELAELCLTDCQPAIIAIGGLSGTGKTTIAESLAPLVGPLPGARVLESDRIRKAIFGKRPKEKLEASAYTSDVSDSVYNSMRNRSAEIGSAGGVVIVDGVFLDEERRKAIERAAREASIPFFGVWLEAASETLFERIETRDQSPSDATPSVLQKQLGRDPGEISWHRVATSGSLEEVLQTILRIVKN